MMLHEREPMKRIRIIRNMGEEEVSLIRVSQPRFSIPSVGSVWLHQLFSSFHHQKYIRPDLHIQCRPSNIAVTSTFSATRGNSKHIAWGSVQRLSTTEF